MNIQEGHVAIGFAVDVRADPNLDINQEVEGALRYLADAFYEGTLTQDPLIRVRIKFPDGSRAEYRGGNIVPLPDLDAQYMEAVITGAHGGSTGQMTFF